MRQKFNGKASLKYFFIFCFFTSFSQNKNTNTDDPLFTKCEVKFADGLVKEGYIHNFLEHSENKDFEDFLYSSIERELGLLDNEFEFKTRLDENPLDIKQKDISEVKLYFQNNDYLVYRLMNIKTLSRDGKIIASSKKAWLPLYKEDVVSIFSFNIWSRREREKSNGKTKAVGKSKKKVTVTYLSNAITDNAFCIYNFEEFKVFGPSYKDKYLGTLFTEIFKDSPKFLSKIINDKKQWNYELYDTTDSELEKEIKMVKNNDLLADEERRSKLDVLLLRKEANPFLRMIEDYKSNFYKENEIIH